MLRSSKRLIYTYLRQAVPLVVDWGLNLLATPDPRIGVSILRECHAST
jgi:hypothetical protein